MQQISELSDPTFRLSSELSKKLEIADETINSSKGIEKDEKIKSNQTKLPDNVNDERIFDIKERCYDDSHIQLLKEYFFYHEYFLNFRLMICF